jgi:hypothetical protein
VGIKINLINKIPFDLQRTYVLIAVTSEMFFYGIERRRRCPACDEYIDRYSHIQYLCERIQPEVDSEEISLVLSFSRCETPLDCEFTLNMIEYTVSKV